MIKQQLTATENSMPITSLTFTDLIFCLDERSFKQIYVRKVINEIMKKIAEENKFDYYFSDMENILEMSSKTKDKPKKIGSTYSDETKSLCIQLFNEGKSLRQISRKIGIGHHTVRKYIKKFKKGELK